MYDFNNKENNNEMRVFHCLKILGGLCPTFVSANPNVL